MDDVYATALLQYFNHELDKMLEEMRKNVEQHVQSRSLSRLFYLGCGFTEFLQKMFCFLSFGDVMNCRLVCHEWKDFIDRWVRSRHPLCRNLRNWTLGQGYSHSLYCGGQVVCVASDPDLIVCVIKTGPLVVFSTNTFSFLTLLDPGPVSLWALDITPDCIVGLTDSQLMVYSRPSFQLVVRIRHGARMQPYLSTSHNLLVIPGDSKYITRVLLYKPTTSQLQGIRDLDHGRHWVLDVSCDSLTILTLSLFAYGTNTVRELRLWDILTGVTSSTITVPGGVGGRIKYSPPYALMTVSSSSIGIWNLETRQRVRTIDQPVISFAVSQQFLFLSDRQGNISIFKLNEVCKQDTPDELLWSRRLYHRTEGSETVMASPRFTVCYNLLVQLTSPSSDRLLIMEVK